MSLKSLALQSILHSISAVEQLKSHSGITFLEEVAQQIATTFQRGNKVLIAGNGGSLCDAMHFAEELTGQFRHYRPALSALSLSDPGHITCCGNDFGFDEIFARGVEAHGVANDLLIVLSTSGSSPNIVRVLEKGKELDLFTVSLLGKGGGESKGMAHLEWIVSQCTTSDRIQEAHMTALHIIVELVEEILFSAVPIDTTNKWHEPSLH